MPKPQNEKEFLERNLKIVKKLISTFAEPRKSAVEKMMDGSAGQNYYLSPASTKAEFYGAYPGGLCEHSINTLLYLRKLTQNLRPNVFSDETLSFVALFHDLGKVGDGGEIPYYLPNQDDWSKNKRGILYEINPDCISLPDAERTLFIFQKHKIDLTQDEYLAIRLSDGTSQEHNKFARFQEPDLALLLHWACVWAARQEKGDK